MKVLILILFLFSLPLKAGQFDGICSKVEGYGKKSKRNRVFKSLFNDSSVLECRFTKRNRCAPKGAGGHVGAINEVEGGDYCAKRVSSQDILEVVFYCQHEKWKERNGGATPFLLKGKGERRPTVFMTGFHGLCKKRVKGEMLLFVLMDNLHQGKSISRGLDIKLGRKTADERTLSLNREMTGRERKSYLFRHRLIGFSSTSQYQDARAEGFFTVDNSDKNSNTDSREGDDNTTPRDSIGGFCRKATKWPLKKFFTVKDFLQKNATEMKRQIVKFGRKASLEGEIRRSLKEFKDPMERIQAACCYKKKTTQMIAMSVRSPEFAQTQFIGSSILLLHDVKDPSNCSVKMIDFANSTVLPERVLEKEKSRKRERLEEATSSYRKGLLSVRAAYMKIIREASISLGLSRRRCDELLRSED